MTAEIGVMNRLGIALAADSAVSLGESADKIYTSADKLFQLSSRAPVAIMINGNANFLGIPWETIVKTYRRSLGDTVFDSVDEYATHFFDYLKTEGTMLPKDMQDTHVGEMVFLLLLHIRNTLGMRFDREAESNDGLSPDELTPIITAHFAETLERVKKSPKLATLPKRASSEIRKVLKKEIHEVRRQVFGELPLEQSAVRALNSIIVEALSRRYFGPFETGVIFAGFGEKEYMPSLINYAVEGMILGEVRCFRDGFEKIDNGNTAAVKPFAQQEMVHSFMQGIEPSLADFSRSSTKQLFFGVMSKVFDAVSTKDAALGRELTEAVLPSMESVLARLFEEWDGFSRDYWMPVVNIVSSLPKDELAAMAEALVNLTKFRRRISNDRETVGGPIDVAIITKGDGFVWVKRKHYFDGELNPRVISKLGGAA